MKWRNRGKCVHNSWPKKTQNAPFLWFAQSFPKALFAQYQYLFTMLVEKNNAMPYMQNKNSIRAGNNISRCGMG